MYSLLLCTSVNISVLYILGFEGFLVCCVVELVPVLTSKLLKASTWQIALEFTFSTNPHD